MSLKKTKVQTKQNYEILRNIHNWITKIEHSDKGNEEQMKAGLATFEKWNYIMKNHRIKFYLRMRVFDACILPIFTYTNI